MAEFSTYLENKIIDHILRNQSYTPPATVYLALFTADNGLEEGTITGEVSGGSYARQSVTLSAASGGASSNTADITFPTATADWGTITHVALMDAASGGNVLMHSALDASKTVNNGDTFKINAGDLDITVS
jgi:hypothetical protein